MNLQGLIDNYLEYLHYEQLASPKTALVRTHELNKFRKYMEEVQGINTILGIKTHHLRSY